MFTPLLMQRVTLYLLRDEAPDAAVALGRYGLFEPARGAGDGAIADRLGKPYRVAFDAATSRIGKIRAHLGMSRKPRAATPPRIVSQSELDDLNAWLGELWGECSEREEQIREVGEELRAVARLDEALNAYEPLDIDLGLLQEKFRFLEVHCGTVPSADVGRLRDAAGLVGYTLTAFSQSEGVTHVLLAGLRHAKGLDQALRAASFSELRIPDEFASHPQRVRVELQQRRESLIARRQSLEQARQLSLADHADRLTEADATLTLASAYARLSDMLRGRGGLAQVAGWVPAQRVDDLRQALQRDIGDRFILESRDPLPEERATVPTMLHHPALLLPFATLVRTYGVPRYGEVDPTWLFALSFVAMFGMMFGDVGHGLVIAGCGWLARGKLRGFAPFVVAAGLSSAAFGFLYGSLFGYEELIHPLWVAPLSEPALMLRLALYWGIAFIVVMTSITIRNRLRAGETAEALLSGSGLAGALFYLGVVVAGARWFGQQPLRPAELAGVLTPLAVVLGYEWHRITAPLGEKIIVVFIEAFDTILGYVANTLSFLRVAAFSLNHAALAIAVFTLADMLGATGHWLVVVLGNAFILVLEGAIVAIQVLRLEYYEGFSRFFSGDGREFHPLTLVPDTATPSRGAGAR